MGAAQCQKFISKEFQSTNYMASLMVRLNITYLYLHVTYLEHEGYQKLLLGFQGYITPGRDPLANPSTPVGYSLYLKDTEVNQCGELGIYVFIFHVKGQRKSQKSKSVSGIFKLLKVYWRT